MGSVGSEGSEGSVGNVGSVGSEGNVGNVGSVGNVVSVWPLRGCVHPELQHKSSQSLWLYGQDTADLHSPTVKGAQCMWMDSVENSPFDYYRDEGEVFIYPIMIFSWVTQSTQLFNQGYVCLMLSTKLKDITWHDKEVFSLCTGSTAQIL